MDQVKQHFEKEAREFDEIILQLIPYYEEIVEAALTIIQYDNKTRLKVMDLGCGTGTLAQKIKEKYPNSRITCVDIAQNMLKMAQSKLQNYSDISYQNEDFQELEFESEYDVIISSLALHHLKSEKQKKKFYNKIYRALAKKGIFINADMVLASNEEVQKVYMEKWKSFMQKNVSKKEVENKWIPKYHQEDWPVKMMQHIQWLQNIGFKEVDVVWKYYNYAVYTGKK